MRASDTYTESLFTMSKLEDFIPQSHPLRPIRKMVNEALAHLEGFLTSMYAAQSQGGRPAIAPREAFACHAAAGVLQHPIGAPTDGADAVQPALSLVHWACDGRSGVGTDGVHQEPRSAA